MQGHRISVISVPVRDPAVAKAFYVEVLGFEVLMDEQFGDDLRWVMLRPPGCETAVTLTTWYESMPPGTLAGTVLSVPDIDAAVAELRGHGVLDDDDEIESAPWGRSVAIEDPDGNRWIVQQDNPLPIRFDQ
ncbi:MAG TPA: glyoxalase superfamily protein [Acidimicrobiales bacterium]|nr:glyoxalase superfamily protein [Acidimicrobiales bacterium]